MSEQAKSDVKILTFAPGQVLKFKYRNWKGDVAIRVAEVIDMLYGSNEWHPDNQWLLKANDLEKNSVRYFAVRDMIPLDGGN